jgi:Esterase-like activity of phytase
VASDHGIEAGVVGPAPAIAAGLGVDVAAEEWTFVADERGAPESPLGDWVGCSEPTLLPDGTCAVIERDDRLGTAVRTERIHGVDLATADFQAHSGGVTPPIVPKALRADARAAGRVRKPDGLEEFGVTAGGRVFVATDDDLDEAIARTGFAELDRGRISRSCAQPIVSSPRSIVVNASPQYMTVTVPDSDTTSTIASGSSWE